MIDEVKAIYCLHCADLDNMNIKAHPSIYSVYEKYCNMGVVSLKRATDYRDILEIFGVIGYATQG